MADLTTVTLKRPCSSQWGRATCNAALCSGVKPEVYRRMLSSTHVTAVPSSCTHRKLYGASGAFANGRSDAQVTSIGGASTVGVVGGGPCSGWTTVAPAVAAAPAEAA